MSNSPKDIIKPPQIQPEKKGLACHRFYAPVVVPEPVGFGPNGQATHMQVTPRLGNFNCIQEKCTLWNKDAQECYDVTQAKAFKLMSEYAFDMKNNIASEGGI